MKKILNFRTKIEVVIAFSVVTCLIISSAIAVTVKWGTDDSSQSWAGYTDDMITNSNGKAWSPTGTNLQQAIWDLNSSNGGIVYLPEANISVSSTISILRDNITLIGGGRGTKLYADSDVDIIYANGEDVAFPNDLVGFTVKWILFSGNPGGGNTHAGVKVENCHHVKINYCYFEYLKYGIYMGGSLDKATDNNWVHSNHFYGITTNGYSIYLESECQENSIHGNTMDGSTSANGGIYVAGKNNVVSSNTIEEMGNTAGYGIYLGGYENVCVANTVRETYIGIGCTALGSGYPANAGHVVSGNLINDNLDRGMSVDQGEHVITGNIITDNTNKGIWILADCNQSIISNNVVSGHTEDLKDDSSSSTHVLSGNVFGINYNVLEMYQDAYLNYTGYLWLMDDGSQVFEFDSSGDYSYIRGQENAGSILRLQPGNGYPLIDIDGSDGIYLYCNDGAGDEVKFFEKTTEYLSFGLVGNDAEIDAGDYNVTINDCLKIEPQSDAPSSPVAGMIYYDSDDNKLKCYNGAGWQDLY